jgi:hypothetical protein
LILHLTRQSLTLIKASKKELMDTQIKTFILLLVAIALVQSSLGHGMQIAIESIAARDQYWPARKPETELLKIAFLPLQPLALELKNYLVPGNVSGTLGRCCGNFRKVKNGQTPFSNRC